MIRRLDGGREVFALDTANTTYCFAIRESGHPEHIYYGARITLSEAADILPLTEKREFEPGNVIAYSKDHPTEVPEDTGLEFSAPGHGDLREPFLELCAPDGCRSSDFLYENYVIDSEKPAMCGLPGSYSDGGYEHLCVTLRDGDVVLELHYCVYAECDVITRWARIVNRGEGEVRILRLLSTQVDIPRADLSVTVFRGAWAREMQKHTVALSGGKAVNESRAGCSSSRANPFFMVHEPSATETAGEVYGFNLIYSGNHYSAAEVSAFGRTRVVCGLQPQGFEWTLAPGCDFTAPEAVMTYSAQGFAQQSLNMHRFVKAHILRGKWKHEPRPILLNSWEACYFNVSEGMLVSMAKELRELGLEMLVLDDGWFGERSDDKRSLGDWEPNKKKLPGGLARLGEKICSHGTEFGVWVEPEMVNTESELYKAHPEWVMEAPGRLHSEGRNQRVLDLANPEVCDWVIGKMSEVFSSARISYVKWDMNRVFTDVYSPSLPAEKQGETAHRYMLGLYRIMHELTEKFPEILFEGCASGGNRFDLGILCFFPQIWGSDNTDPVSRLSIQEGYSYAYPQCCVGAHVAASPNHQTLRETPVSTRFAVAAFGALGYECDLRDMNAADKKAVAAQTEIYKEWRDVFQYGDFYRVKTGNVREWLAVSPDKKRAVGMLIRTLAEPNTQTERFFAKGLDKDVKYRFYSVPANVDIKQFGSLINTMAPIHVRQDSMLHNVIAKFVKMGGDAEDCTLRGDALMNAGVALKQAFSGTGLNENVRVFPDFASRLYFIEAVEDESGCENT